MAKTFFKPFPYVFFKNIGQPYTEKERQTLSILGKIMVKFAVMHHTETTKMRYYHDVIGFFITVSNKFIAIYNDGKT